MATIKNKPKAPASTKQKTSKPVAKKASAPQKNQQSQKAQATSQTTPRSAQAEQKKAQNPVDSFVKSKAEGAERADFVNPLHNLDTPVEAKGAESKPESGAAKEADKPKETKLPEGVTKEKGGQVVKQVQNFAALATHLPEILKMQNEIKDGGIQAKHVETLKAAYEPMKGVLTPENIKAFKGLDANKVDQLLSGQNMDILKSLNPKFAETLNPEKIAKLKEGFQNAQGFLDQKKLGETMSMMSPFVRTTAGEGALNTVARMVDDPKQLGGADRQLSLTDMGQVTNGLLNTRPVQGIVNGKINDGINHAVNYRQDGRPRTNLGRNLVGNLTSRPKVREKIYDKAWGQVRQQAPGMVTKQAAPYLSNNGSAQDRSIPRSFDNGEIQNLVNVGKQLQSSRGQTGSSGYSQIDNANSAMAGMTGMLHKSVIGDDGMISGQELRTVSGFGGQMYNYLGLLYEGVGGQYR